MNKNSLDCPINNAPKFDSAPAETHSPQHGRVLVIGLGNPILGDDGVGWRVAEEIRRHCASLSEVYPPQGCEIDCLSVGGLSLMERMVGYDQVILIDAVQTGKNPPGTVIRMNLKEFPNRALGHLTSSHDTTLQNALEIGRLMGAHLPHTIWVIGIEAQQVFDFSETLSSAVSAAVPKAAQRVMELLTPVFHEDASDFQISKEANHGFA